MARSLAAVVLIGLAAGLIPTGAAAAAQRHSGDHGHWQGPGYAVEDVGPNTPVATAGVRPGDRIMAIDGRAVNNSADIDRAMQRSGHLVVVDVERAGRHLRLKIAPRALTPSEAQQYTQEYAEEHTVRSRRVLGVVEQRFILRPGTGANDVYIPPPIPPDPPAPSAPIIVN
jgi:membrane-associated protease RseP (regulator of RpoE activity)